MNLTRAYATTNLSFKTHFGMVRFLASCAMQPDIHLLFSI